MADDCRLTCASRRDFFAQISGTVLAALAGGDAASAKASYPMTEMAAIDAGPSQAMFPLPSADGVAIDKKVQVILVRFQGRVIAFNLACPHENTALRWKPAVNRFECTKHDSKYAPDGKYIGGRATRNMDRLLIKRDGANLIVDLSKVIKSDVQPGEWAAAVITI
jgi:nitrite reductase/ring-hydroxylating ferredoxin subunit